jgi:hypothetical protein
MDKFRKCVLNLRLRPWCLEVRDSADITLFGVKERLRLGKPSMLCW